MISRHSVGAGFEGRLKSDTTHHSALAFMHSMVLPRAIVAPMIVFVFATRFARIQQFCMSKMSEESPQTSVGKSFAKMGSAYSDLVTRPSILAALLAALLALTAFWISCGHFQRSEYADSLVPILVSLQRWTPFYWEQDRYGMLVPLLAIPIRNPLWNMLVQSALNIFACLSASFLLVIYLFDDFVWLVAAALQSIWFFLIVPKETQFGFCETQVYGLSLALGMAGLLLLRKRRKISGLIFLLLATWVNSGAFIVLLPIFLSGYLLREKTDGFWGDLGLLLLSTAAGLFGKVLSGAPHTPSALTPVGSWPSAWRQLFQNGRDVALIRPSLLWWILAPAVVGLLAMLPNQRKKQVLLAVTALVGTAIGNWLFMGTLAWVKANEFANRYVFSSMFLLGTAAAILTISPLQKLSSRTGRYAALFATVFVFIAGAITYGLPSKARVQHDLDDNLGSITGEVLSSHPTLIAGNYWKVWPAVFHANLTLYQRRQHRTVYGLTYRSTPTISLWSHQIPVCAATSVHDPDANFYMAKSGRQFIHAKTLHTVDLLCAR